VDGLILAASLVLLHEARNGRDAPRLARVMLWLGISATVGANIAYGAGFGLLGAVISAWPAVAFIGSVEHTQEEYQVFVRVYGFDIMQWSGYPVLGSIREFLMVTWVISKAAESDWAAAEARKRISALRTGASRKDWQPS
jgi:hypothetical protein